LFVAIAEAIAATRGQCRNGEAHPFAQRSKRYSEKRGAEDTVSIIASLVACAQKAKNPTVADWVFC
jgi:hypothetical protein